MSNLADMFGSNCQVFDDDENLASVGTDLLFWDEDPLYLFVEQVESRIRIFDDGEVVMHMFGSGIEYRNENFMESVAQIAALGGVSLNAAGELEIWDESSRCGRIRALHVGHGGIVDVGVGRGQPHGHATGRAER